MEGFGELPVGEAERVTHSSSTGRDAPLLGTLLDLALLVHLYPL